MIIRPSRMRRAELIALMGQERNSYRVFLGKAEEKKILRRTRFRRKDAVKRVIRK
jgi:hypothetical protein